MTTEITIRPASGTWTVRAGGAVLGETTNALELVEGDHGAVQQSVLLARARVEGLQHRVPQTGLERLERNFLGHLNLDGRGTTRVRGEGAAVDVDGELIWGQNLDTKILVRKCVRCPAKGDLVAVF